MRLRSKTDQAGGPVLAHSDEVFEGHERMLRASPVRSRHIEVRSGRRVHVIDGRGRPGRVPAWQRHVLALGPFDA